MGERNDDASCNCGPAGCRGNTRSVDRRTFLKAATLGVAAMPLMAGPFAPVYAADEGPIPLDKKLAAAWRKSLFERGEPTVYRGWDQLRYIGMPVGGIGCGTVYLGGDGKLWCWDIFNQPHLGVVPNTISGKDYDPGQIGRDLNEIGGANYVDPPVQESPWNFEQGFAVRGRDEEGNAFLFKLDHENFDDIVFTAQYPIGKVRYNKPELSLAVTLEAFSPFIPLDTGRSSFPATILRFSVDHGPSLHDVELVGWLGNPVLGRNGSDASAQRVNRVFRGKGVRGVEVFAEPLPDDGASAREDILFEDFEGDTWGEWTADGTAFEGGPFDVHALKDYQKVKGIHRRQFVNSHNTRLGGDVAASDDLTGTLTSPPFTITRRYINLRVAGGSRDGEQYVAVVVDGEVVARATGDNSNTLRDVSMNVAAWEGREARIHIVDNAAGGWGNIQADHIVFSDAVGEQQPIKARPDFGSLALIALHPGAAATARYAAHGEFQAAEEARHTGWAEKFTGAVRIPCDDTSSEAVFVVAWHFPNANIPGYPEGGKRAYAAKYANARDVAIDVAAQCDELTRLTRLWHDTWYGGTLPHWFLERTLVTADALQTNTCHRFDDGRFWAWEGVGCCAGTCTHVWHYAQAVGRLFPDLERDLRERTDYGIAFNEETGLIRFRGEFNDRDATDGQAGVVLRTHREHQMSPDGAFLHRVWPHCKKALEFLIGQDARDGEPDGIPVGEQHNTLDAEWFGKIPALASLYLAALRAGERMARDMGDTAFERRCATIFARGQESIKKLFDPERGYFVQEEDPEHLDAIGIGKGCYIDQVMGQWWAHQLGLGRLYDEGMIRSALQRLWDYNFCPDMGRLRASIAGPNLRGRAYALAGDAGLVMCTWPKGGMREDWEKFWQFGYFNECMTGFEYEAAGHMIWEGTPQLVEQGLAICRAIHDRYDGRLRNPFNEIECSDHYARAMASYGAFLGACGFEYDGPRGHIGFAPRLTPELFNAAFTTAEGWGVIRQDRLETEQACVVHVRYGKLTVKSMAFEVPEAWQFERCQVGQGNDAWTGEVVRDGARVLVTLPEPVVLDAGSKIEVHFAAERGGR